MSVKKELIIGVKTALGQLGSLEYIDLQKGQYDDPNKTVAGQYYTGALIEIGAIDWQPMTNGIREGKTRISVYLYVKDGFMYQFKGAADPNDGLDEIELIDDVITKLDGFKTANGNFKPLYLANEETMESPVWGIMVYKIDFTTNLYKRFNQKYTLTPINLNPIVNVSNQI